MLARQRRERDLLESRVAERERQQGCRARRRAAGDQGPPQSRLSRATLPVQRSEIDDQILALVDHEMRRSRATLGRQLRRILVKQWAIVDQGGP